jgi:hypothetical protein
MRVVFTLVRDSKNIVLNFERSVVISKEATTTNKHMLLNPVVLFVRVLVKSDKDLVDEIAVLKSVFLGLVANHIGNGLVETNNAVVLDKITGAIFKRAKDLAVKVKMRALGRDGNVITATVDSRVEGKVLIKRGGRTRLDGSNVYTMLVLAMQSPWGKSTVARETYYERQRC